jgi:hypothetical protein
VSPAKPTSFVALAKKGWRSRARLLKLISMYYVYILKSEKDSSYYKGVTENLKKRVYDHNHGSNKYSSSKAPFKII